MAFNAAIGRRETGEGTVGRKALRAYAVVAGAAAWTITAYRAATTGITYDEAYTYLHYAQTATGFLRLDIANNHPLNSLLIYLSNLITGARYDEVAIRAPNLVAFGIYLFIAYKLAARTRYSLAAFSLLAFNPYLNEFFGLGRGYGLAAAAVLAALWIYATQRTSEQVLVLSLLLLCLASAAIYACLVLVLALCVYAVLIDIGISNLWPFVKRNAFGLAEVVIIAIALGYAFGVVTSPGLPTPTSSAQELGLFSAIPMGYAAMFTDSTALGMILAVLLLAILFGGATAGRRNLSAIAFTSLSLLTLAITVLGAAAFRRPLPTGRLLLPLYPLVALALCESVDALATAGALPTKAAARMIAVGAFSGLLLINFAGRPHLTYTTDWSEDYPLRALMYETVIDHKPQPEIEAAVMAGNPVVEFYALQIRDRIDPNYRIPLEQP